MTASWQTVGLFWDLKSLPESRQSPFRSLVATHSLLCLPSVGICPLLLYLNKPMPWLEMAQPALTQNDLSSSPWGPLILLGASIQMFKRKSLVSEAVSVMVKC